MVHKMKIYEIGTGYTPIPARMGAATEIVVEELVRAFRKKGCQVELVDIKTETRLPNDLPIVEVGVPKCVAGTDVKLGILHKLKRVIYSISLANTLRKILKNNKDEVLLHFHNQYNLFFFLKLVPKPLRSRCTVAYTNHSGIWRQNWEDIRDTIQKRYFQEAECMKKADIVFLLNQETKRNVVEHLGIPEERTVVIDNGVNTDVYYPLSGEDKVRTKKKWGLEGKRVILQVGSVYENKGQLRSVEYLLPLFAKYPDLVFAYAGGVVDESYQEKIRSYAEESGVSDRVRYLGMLTPGEELNTLYNTALVTILPSKYEGFSLVSIESCAAGVPVLADRLGPVRLEGGSVAYDSESLTDTLESAILNQSGEYSRLCAAARNIAVQNYSWDKIAENYQAAFESRMKKYG